MDTNVLVAAFAARGLCAEVFQVCLADHKIVLSESIISEVERALLKKISLPPPITKSIISFLREHTEIVSPSDINELICRDKDDLLIIGTAVSGNVKFLITGDEDLLVLEKYQDIEIISPREFWKRLK